MYLGTFKGCAEDNQGKIYKVISHVYDEQSAIHEANKYFKTKKDQLCARQVYIPTLESDEFDFVPYDDHCYPVYAVWKES